MILGRRRNLVVLCTRLRLKGHSATQSFRLWPVPSHRHSYRARLARIIVANGHRRNLSPGDIIADMDAGNLRPIAGQNCGCGTIGQREMDV